MLSNYFVRTQILKTERRTYIAKIFLTVFVYIGLSILLNSIRATAPIALVWVLIALQFLFYFLIFSVSYTRAKVYGLPNYGLVLFIVLCVLGRINNWEIAVIPLLVVVMIVLGMRNKNLSLEGRSVVE